MSATRPPVAATPGIPAELQDFTERYEAAWNERRPEAMQDLLTDDIVWHDPALPEPARGIPAVQEFMHVSWRAFPDLAFSQPDPALVSVTGDLVAFGWRMTGTLTGPLDPPGFAPTGRSMSVDGADLWRLRDGRIAHYRAFYDLMGMARQLGLMPATGSGEERALVRVQRLRARLQRR